jgi:DNA-directed RNA polymerase II subunit RPB2
MKMDYEDKVWSLLQDYFANKGLIAHQINSYNDFLLNVHRLIEAEPPIRVKLSSTKIYEIELIQSFIDTPRLIEADRSLVKLYPNEARHRQLMYEGTFSVDILVKTLDISNEKNILDTVFHRKHPIAKIPIMINSIKCNLHNTSPAERVLHNECKYDDGGYFIIKGIERVLVAQERMNYNHVYVFNTKSGPKNAYVAEMRTMSEETGHSILIQARITQNKNIVVQLPYIQQPIPVGIVFKAFGFDDAAIWAFLYIADDKTQYIIRRLVQETTHIADRDDALEYIANTITTIACKKRCLQYATQVIDSEMFIHLGIVATRFEKAFALANMICKLISTSVGLRSEDDRDHIANKRVENAGILVWDIFRSAFKRFIKNLSANLAKRPDILIAISRCNTITKDIRTCFSTGNWGVQKSSYIRTGVSQVLSRLSYSAFLSHLRRVVIPVGKDGKNIKIRQIHSSQFGFICPNESPEGASIGIVKNLAILTTVSRHVPTVLVRDILRSSPHIKFAGTLSLGDLKHTKIFVNGHWIGVTENAPHLLRQLYDWRRAGVLFREISISHVKTENEIRIFSDEGRLLRPLVCVENIDRLDSSWDKMIESTVIQYLDINELETITVAMTPAHITTDTAYCELHPSTMLGVCALMIPFSDHNQAPRNTYFASMGKQAISMFSIAHEKRADTVVHLLHYPQKAIVSTKYKDFMNMQKMPFGVNAIVAIACYSAFNQDDSVIINRAAIDRGLFVSSTYKTVIVEERVKGALPHLICYPDPALRVPNLCYSNLDPADGIVRPGSFVTKTDILVGKIFRKILKTGEEDIKDTSIRSPENAIVDRVIISHTPDGFKLVKIKLRSLRIPEVGDKFCSNSAQKGTCGMIFPQEDMPFTADGIVPDIIMNSHAIPSRMTISQLLECVMGKKCLLQGTYGDGTPFSKNSTNIAERVCDELKGQGFERHGVEMMCNGMTGEPLKMRIFIGPTYYMKLKHMVCEKEHARSFGNVNILTNQPTEGRSRDGGLRFGEMERDCMITHGVSNFLRERLFDMSDPFTIMICKKCGNIMVSQYSCKFCTESDQRTVNIPYASKLLIQQLMAMNLKQIIKSID